MPLSLTLRQLKYLAVIAETGNLTKAARILHVSQSALSMAVADLEETLDVQLLIRQPRGVMLTKVGNNVVTSARRLLSGVEDLRNVARDAHESLSGPLMIGCYNTLSYIVLPRVIAAFAERNPAVDLRFVEGSHEFLQNRLRHGVLDLAVMYRYGPELVEADTDLVHTTILNSSPYVLLPTAHHLTKRETVRLRDLTNEPMILFDLPPGAEYFRGLFAAEGLTPTVRFSTTSFEMVRALVARGLGYSILSQRPQIQLSYEGHEYAVRPLSCSGNGLDIDVVQLANARPTLRAEAFIDECRRAFDSADPPDRNDGISN